MKPYSGYTAEAPSRREILPAGGYVAKILDASEVSYSWGNVLLISFDIYEGDKAGFFRQDYDGQLPEDRKWRGTYRLRVPKDDGTEQDNWSKKTFNRAMYAIEASNSGYHWDWNEAGLKGKVVGVLYRNKEWEMDGKTGWTTECCAMIAADDIRQGKFKMPKDKPLANLQHTAYDGAVPPASSEISENDLPF